MKIFSLTHLEYNPDFKPTFRQGYGHNLHVHPVKYASSLRDITQGMVCTYQQKNFAVWFDFMLLHVFDQTAVCVPVGREHIVQKKNQIDRAT